jgi:hypothetical protein
LINLARLLKAANRSPFRPDMVRKLLPFPFTCSTIGAASILSNREAM